VLLYRSSRGEGQPSARHKPVIELKRTVHRSTVTLLTALVKSGLETLHIMEGDNQRIFQRSYTLRELSQSALHTEPHPPRHSN
jgi:hypothetical protein